MTSLNKVILIGRLGSKPEIRMTRDEVPVLTVGIATNEYYKDKSGERKETTEWHQVVFWRRLAELAERYLDKGSRVYVEGKLKTSEWSDKNGNKRYTTEIIAENLQFMDSPNQRSGQPQPFGSGRQDYGQPAPTYQGGNESGGQAKYGSSQGYGGDNRSNFDRDPGKQPAKVFGEDDFIEDDIPF